MAERVRTFDWGPSPVGAARDWPPALASAVDLMLEAAQPVFIGWGPDLVSFYNDGFIPFLGRRHPEALGRPLRLVWAELWREQSALARAIRGGEARHFVDQAIRLPGGRVGWFTFSLTPLRDGKGRVAGLYCAATETTGTVRAERGRRRREAVARESLAATLDEFFALSHDLLAVASVPEERWMRVNAAFTRILGWSEAELLAMPLFEILHPDDVARSRAATEKVVAGSALVEFENRFRCRDGSYRWISWSCRAGPGGALLFCVGRDVTEQREAAAALSRSYEMLRLALDAGGMGAWRSNFSSGIAEIDATLQTLFDVDAPDGLVPLRELESRIHPDDLPAVRARWEATGPDTVRARFRVRRRDGGERWLFGVGKRIGAGEREGEGEDIAVGLNVDITGQVAAEERQAMLMAELDHRVKNTLALVLSIARQTLKQGEAEGAPKLVGRIAALAKAHALLSETQWQGAPLRALVERIAAPRVRATGAAFATEGPDETLTPKAAQTLALALHELAENAARHGAAAAGAGRVDVFWRTGADGDGLVLVWRESGAGPVAPPAGRGFGARLLEDALAVDLGGRGQLTFAPSGLVATLELPRTVAARAAAGGPPAAAGTTPPGAPPRLAGRRCRVAGGPAGRGSEIAHALRRTGATVEGPLTPAAACLCREGEPMPDAAVIDPGGQGHAVWPAVRALRDCGVPVLIADDGRTPGHIPPDLAGTPRLEPPFDADRLARAVARLWSRKASPADATGGTP